MFAPMSGYQFSPFETNTFYVTHMYILCVLYSFMFLPWAISEDGKNDSDERASCRVDSESE